MDMIRCHLCGTPDFTSAATCKRCGRRLSGFRARYVVVPVALALILALFAAVRYFDEKAKEARLNNLRAGIGVRYDIIDASTGAVDTDAAPTPQTPWFRSWFRSRPTAEEVFEYNLGVSGGAEAVAAVKSHRSTGTLTFSPVRPAGIYYSGENKLPPPAKIVTYAKAPDKILTELEMASAAQFPEFRQLIRRGFDGQRGWEYIERYEREPGAEQEVKRAELREMEGSELEQARHYASAGGLVRVAKQFDSLVMLDNQKVSQPRYRGLKQFDRECYVVRGLNRQNRLETFYFDIDTGLLLRFDFDAQGPDGPATIEAYPEDYREVGKLLLAFRLTFKSDDVWVAIVFDQFKLNDTIPDSAFEMPTS
ncbi:MAG TPA: hypothetical protein VF588_19205 [Pyrinomonadaceae bacterium]|jgi:hypothetical protein